jgi:hypothetical protein
VTGKKAPDHLISFILSAKPQPEGRVTKKGFPYTGEAFFES